MAWGAKSEIDPKEILGMDPSELNQKLGKIDSLEARLAEMNTKTEQGLSSILERLEQKAAEAKPAEDDSLDFLADPEGAVNKRVAPFERQTLENTVMLQHRAARDLYPRDFDRWGTEIVEKMGELSLQQQADSRVWQAMVLMVRGSHASDLERDGATGKFGYLEPVSAGLRPDPKNADNLSNEERKMVKVLSGFGMTAEKYNHGKQRLEKARMSRLGRFSEEA